MCHTWLGPYFTLKDFKLKWRKIVWWVQVYWLCSFRCWWTNLLLVVYNVGSRECNGHFYPGCYGWEEMFWPWLLKGWIMLSTGWIAIQWISVNKTNHAICWIVIYPVDSVLQPLNNWAQDLWYKNLVVSNSIILFIMDDSAKVAASQGKELFKAREIDFDLWETDIFKKKVKKNWNNPAWLI